MNKTALKNKMTIYGGLIGWVLITIWTVIAYNSAAIKGCSMLSRFNLAEAPGAAFFYVASVVFFSISAYCAYVSFKEHKVDFFSPKIVTICITVIILLAFLMPSLNTHDINFYFGAGQAIHNGQNVFVENWSMKDYFFCPPISGQTSGIMYGPLTTIILAVIYGLSSGNVVVFILLWKILMLAALVLSFYVALQIIKNMTPLVDKDSFRLLWLVQPLMIWAWLGNGQFEVLWILFVLLAVLFAVKKNWLWVIIFLIIGVWIKFIPLLLSPWFILWWWQSFNKDNFKKNLNQTLLGLVGAGLITYVLWQPFWQGTAVFKSIILQSKWAVNSVFSVLYYSLKDLFVLLFAGHTHLILTSLLQGLLLICVVYLIYPLLRRARLVLIKKSSWLPMDYILAIFISLTVYLGVWQKSFWPWYVSWLLPFGLVLFFSCQSIFLKKILIWLSIAPMFFYVVWIINHVTRGTDPTTELWFQWLVVLLVWVYPLVNLIKWRKNDYDLNKELK